MCFNLVQSGVSRTIPVGARTVRQTVTLPAPVARKILAAAQAGKTKARKVIAALIGSRLEARERFAVAAVPEGELTRRTFGAGP